MFERFTELARQVVVLSQEEARELGHGYIGTEHLLLGLMREQRGLAAQVLEARGVEIERVRTEVVGIVGHGEGASAGNVPFTPRAKKVLELSLRESQRLRHGAIDTEHILLGLLREKDGVAVRVLLDLGQDRRHLRSAVLEGMGTSAGVVVSPPLPGLPSSGLLQHVAPATVWLTPAVEMVRHELGRPADDGDLLLLLAAPGSLVGGALERLGIDLERLREALNEQRHHRLDAPPAPGNAEPKDEAMRREQRELRQRLGLPDRPSD